MRPDTPDFSSLFAGRVYNGTDANFRSEDVNGDGKTDLVLIKDGSIEVWTLNDNNDFELLISENNSNIDRDKPLLSGDFNGDGKIDYVTPNSEGSSLWTVFKNSGASFFSEAISLFPYNKSYSTTGGSIVNYNYLSYDVDNDGKTDLLKHEADLTGNTQNYTFDIELNTSSFRFYRIKKSYIINNDVDSIPGAFVKSDVFINSNEDNSLAYLRGDSVDFIDFNINTDTSTRLTKVENNNYITNIEYEPYMDISSFEDLEYPLMSLTSIPNAKLVSSVTEIVGNGNDAKTRTKQFKYFGATTHTQGLGFLGFRKVAQTNWQGTDIATLWTSTGYDMTHRGIPLYTAITENEPENALIPNDYISLTELTNSTAIGDNGVFIGNLTSSTSNNTLTGVQTSTSNTYDAYNNLSTTTNTFPGGNEVSRLFYANSVTSDSYYWVGILVNKTNTRTLGTESFETRETFGYTFPKINVSNSNSYSNSSQSIIQKYEYDDFGNVLKTTISTSGLLEDKVETYTYDSTGRFPESITNNDGFTTQFTYDKLKGTLLSETDYIGKTKSLEYDGWDRITKETDYLGNWITTSYTDSRNTGELFILKESSLRSDGYFQYIAVDRSGDVLESSVRDEFGSNITTKTEYDAIGRVKRQSAPYKISANNWTYYYYDEYNRPFQQVDYTGKTTNLTYEGLSTSIDDGTQIRTRTTDAIGNVTQIIDDGGTIDYSYYANGSPKTTNVNGHIITSKIDDWGRKTELNDPAAGKYTYTYDNLGQLLAETKPAGNTIYEYDDGGRLLSKKTSGSNKETTTEYQYSTYKQLSTVNHQDAISNKSSSINYIYDSNLRVTSITEIGLATFRRYFTYDNYGRLDTDEIEGSSQITREGASSKVTTQNIYSSTSGMLIGVKDVDTNTTLWEANSANEYGNYTSINLGNGISKSKTFDSYGYLTTINDNNPNISDNEVFNAEYTWDTNTGNLLSRKHNFNNITETFKYDSHDRLISASGSANKTIGYENNGNIKTKTEIGSYTYDPASTFRMESIDLNTEGENYYKDHTPQRITYNVFKQPLSINEVGNGKVDFEYGAMGSRSTAYYGGELEDKNDRDFTKLYSSIAPVEIIFDNKNSTSKVITYLFGDAYTAPVAYLDAGSEDKFVYLHRDHLGSINAITNQDGNIIENAHYGVWGNVEKYWDANGNTTLGYNSVLGRGYTGHEHFTSVSLIHMNGRMYDPQLGRFLSPDNYVQEPFNTQSFNRYSYVMNNPLKYNDPSGEMGNCPECPPTDEQGWDGPSISISPELADEIWGWYSGIWEDVYDVSGIEGFANQNFESIRNDIGNFADQTWDAVTDAANFVDKNVVSALDDIGIGNVRIKFGGINIGWGSSGGGSSAPKDTKTYFEGSSQSISIGSGGNRNIVSLNSPPKSTRTFEGVLGKLNYFWNGGIENGGRYNLDGDFVGLAPITGIAPDIGLGSGARAIIKGGNSFFSGTKYTNKVLSQISSGDFHSFPEKCKSF